jgi:predicted dehydrogenase
VGSVVEVVCAAGRLSSLQIETEDVAALICRHVGGSLSEIHLDYVQRTYERGCHVAGDEGTILWDFASGCVRYQRADEGHWQVVPQPKGWELNQMYLDELQHLLDCVRVRRPTVLPIGDAVEVLRIALAAKTSAATGCFVATAAAL